MNEDFVSFDLAKKLKEKGFQQDYNIFGYKLIYSNNTTIKYISNIGAYDKEYFGENVSCPTISQVLKWLRKEKKIHISIDYKCRFGKWYWCAYSLNKQEKVEVFSECIYENYEQTAIAGIEYVIDNLI